MTPHSIIVPGRRISDAVLRTQSDERLVALAKSGSGPAFEAIVARYRPPLLRYCARLVDEARSEDVVQDAMMRAYTALGRGEHVRALRPWLYRIVHNTALNHLRQRAGSEAMLDDRLPGGEAPDQAFERGQGLSAAVAAVRALPMRQRDAIVLRELEGRSYDEIAGELGVTRGAARQLLSRARTSMRAGMTAVLPVGPIVRLAAPLGDGPAAARLAEVGGGGAVPKLCAVALAAGALAGGSGELPSLGRGAPAPESPRAESAGPSGARNASGARTYTAVAGGPATPRTRGRRAVVERSSVIRRREAAGDDRDAGPDREPATGDRRDRGGSRKGEPRHARAPTPRPEGGSQSHPHHASGDGGQLRGTGPGGHPGGAPGTAPPPQGDFSAARTPQRGHLTLR